MIHTIRAFFGIYAIRKLNIYGIVVRVAEIIIIIKVNL